MVKSNNHRLDRNRLQFNRLHEIIARREAREGSLQSSILRHTAIFQQTLANAQYLDCDRNRPSLCVFNNNFVHLQQPATPAHLQTSTPFLPPFQPSIINTVQPYPVAQLYNNNSVPSLSPSTLNNSGNNLLTPVPISLPPPPGTNAISLPSDSSSTIGLTVERILQDYRTSTELEPYPPRFAPNHAPPPPPPPPPPPSNVLHPSYSSSPSQPPSHQAFFAPSQQHWSHAD